jgi:hypothetical protein
MDERQQTASVPVLSIAEWRATPLVIAPEQARQRLAQLEAEVERRVGELLRMARPA